MAMVNDEQRTGQNRSKLLRQDGGPGKVPAAKQIVHSDWDSDLFHLVVMPS